LRSGHYCNDSPIVPTSYFTRFWNLGTEYDIIPSIVQIENDQEYPLLREIWELVWSRFKIIAGIIGDVEASIIAIGFYYTILVPFGLLARFSGKTLKQKDKVEWLERPLVPSDLDSAKRQG